MARFQPYDRGAAKKEALRLIEEPQRDAANMAREIEETEALVAGLKLAGLISTISIFKPEPDAGFVLCPHHGYYWSEDGCADCAAEEEQNRPQPLPAHIEALMQFFNCPTCGTRFWGEDECPKCYPNQWG